MSLFKLDYQGIDGIIRETTGFLQNNGVERKEIVRIRLPLEEMLMKYQ